MQMSVFFEITSILQEKSKEKKNVKSFSPETFPFKSFPILLVISSTQWYVIQDDQSVRFLVMIYGILFF